MSLYLKKDNGMLLQEYEGYRRHLFCKKVCVVFFIAEGTSQAAMLTFLKWSIKTIVYSLIFIKIMEGIYERNR